ncbi:MAG: hypothetical protein LBD35_05880 [Prevotellaceae bacterium]|nr:hypothetical protein [Prevotellaceae bacterium]
MILSQKQRGESGRVPEMEKIAGQARNDRPAAGSVPAVQPSSRPFVHSSIRPFAQSSVSCRLARLLNAPSGRTVIAGLTRNLFHLQNAHRLSALFLRQYHFAI